MANHTIDCPVCGEDMRGLGAHTGCKEDTVSSANERQIGGDHYRAEYQHWDFVEMHGLGYLEGNATKYATRWRKKNGRQDLEKAVHYVDKLIELHRAGTRQPRGMAPLSEIVKFSESNELTPAEDTVVIYLSRWQNLGDLEQARAAILRLIVECNNAEDHTGDG